MMIGGMIGAVMIGVAMSHAVMIGVMMTGAVMIGAMIGAVMIGVMMSRAMMIGVMIGRDDGATMSRAVTRVAGAMGATTLLLSLLM
jgi:hypothetical protein